MKRKPKKSDQRTAVAYCRVSTLEQSTEGVSLATQREKCRAYASLHSLKLIGEFSDSISGTKDDRGEYVKAVALAKKNNSVLIAYSLSRLSRSTTELLRLSIELEKAGADLASLSENLDTSSASGRLIFRIFASLAEFERDQLSERTSAALQHKKKLGLRVSGFAPIGYSFKDGNVVKDSTEQKYVKLIRKLRGKGLSYRKIQAELKAKGIPTRSGGTEWRVATIHVVVNAEGPDLIR